MFEKIPPSVPLEDEWEGFDPLALIVGNEGLPPEVLRGDMLICRTHVPLDYEVPQGVLAVLVVEASGRELTLVRHVYWTGRDRRYVVLPGPPPECRPAVIPYASVKILAPVLEVRRRFVR